MIFMKNIQHQIRGVLAAGIFVGALNCGAQQTNNTDSVPAFSTFNIITRNNIFDPNRTGRIVTDHTPRVRRTVDVLKLVVGIIQNLVAWFQSRFFRRAARGH